jgi:hypothetical protein
MQGTPPERAEELDAVHIRHPEIQQDRVEGQAGSGKERERRQTVLRPLELVLLRRERQRSHLPDELGVFDNQQPHGGPSGAGHMSFGKMVCIRGMLQGSYRDTVPRGRLHHPSTS